MMRLGIFGTTGAGLLWLLLPTLAQSSEEVAAGPRERALRQARDERTRAVASLIELRTRLEQGSTEARAQVTSFTEHPEGSGRDRDERLDELRRQVAELELVLEGARTARESGVSAHKPELAPGGLFKIGLDEAELALIRPPTLANGAATRAPQSGSHPLVGTPSSSQGTTRAQHHERSSPRAGVDPLRQARAAFHAGQFDRALDLLRDLEPSAETLYWRARCFERTERLEQAIGSLRLAEDVLESEEGEASELARRVRADLEYLEWLQQLRETSRDLRPGSGSSR